MSLYNVIQNNTNKYIPYHILPEPTIMYVYNNKPINKSIQKNQLDINTYLNTLSTDDIDSNNNDNDNAVCEIVYIRIKRNDTNSSSEWKKIIQKS
jgi:hypothetical protein